MNLIIIEDEVRMARELKKMIEHVDTSIVVLAVLPSVVAAVKWLQENEAPDLIFSDIQLGDGLSFDIFKQVKTNAPIIFCTAYDEYAIQSFEANSIDYLLKPIEEEMLEKSLEKYDRIRQHYHSNSQLYTQNLNKALVQMEKTYKKSILVHFREKIIPVKVSEICYIHSSNGFITLTTMDKINYVVQYTIEQLENMLNPEQFFKANRQYLINRESIQDVEHYFNRRLIVKISCDSSVKLIVSRTKSHEFLEWMES